MQQQRAGIDIPARFLFVTLILCDRQGNYSRISAYSL
jgi:hypothetical protein